MKTLQIKTAFLLGAGLGTRLLPMTLNCPKPLLPVNGRPIITYAMDHVLTAGVERFIVNTHHMADGYAQAFPDAQWRGVPIVFRHEPVLLDTAGGLKNIEDLIEDDERLLVYNADIIADLPLEPLLDAHAGRKREVTLVLRSDGPLMNVDMDEEDRICDMRGLLQRPGVKRCAFTGIYLVEKPFLSRLEAGRIESVVPVFIRMLREQSGSVGSVLIDDGQWYDIGTPESYRRIMDLKAKETGEASITFSIPGAVPMGPGHNEQAQPFETIDDAAVVPYVCDILKRPASSIEETAFLAKGGSDRTFRRIRFRDASSVIFMHYNTKREENRYYADIAGFLQDIGVAVPRILAHDAARCFILMEDLGNTDLWSLRQAPWEKRSRHYRLVLGMIHNLHSFPMDAPVLRTLPLMPGFGPELYRWERNYFRENLVEGACGISLGTAEAEALEAELSALALRVQQAGAGLIHRDFQSQNILICGDHPVLVDFQGLRTGSFFYDLGSLLYDPYVSFGDAGRLELLRYYYELGRRDRGWETFQQAFHEASVQRLMQALGAYGFLGLRHNRSDFLAHIPAGLAHLAEAAARCGGLRQIEKLTARCREVIDGKRDSTAPERL
jgi:NDP-sugar pyrophosphorylase family protein/aminoglycoside phosphotransferase (APT) family kinase protein